jgi:hypothetical protein
MPTKLGIYQEALRIIGSTRLSAIDDDVESRYVLDDAWADSVDTAQEEGFWNFATNTASVTGTGGSSHPSFEYSFTKPTGWLRTVAISGAPNFMSEVQYVDEQGTLYANVSPIYIRYIDSRAFDDDDISTWPRWFAALVAARLAMDVCEVLTKSNVAVEKTIQVYSDRVSEAKNRDAQDQAQQRRAYGSWVKSLVGRNTFGDRGTLYPSGNSVDTIGDV